MPALHRRCRSCYTEASAEAKEALNEFEVKSDVGLFVKDWLSPFTAADPHSIHGGRQGPGRNFFNEPLDSDRPSFGERAEAASEQGKGVFAGSSLRNCLACES